MSRFARYTESDDKYIREHYGIEPAHEIAAKLGRSVKSIRRHWGELNSTRSKATAPPKPTKREADKNDIETIAAEALAAGMSYGQYVSRRGR